ncbi:MAG: DUF7281 domain-containing protein [Gammaproteobacteria bacterium]
MSQLSDALKCLLASPEPLTASTFSAGQRAALQQFARDTRLLDIVKQGRATVYRLIDRERAADYLRALQPLDAAQLPDHLPSRSRNIGSERDSKKGHTSHGAYYLLLKAWHKSAYWQNGSNTLPAAQLTAQFGAAALHIAPGDAWRSDSALWLVENQALFDRCDWLPGGFSGCLAYYAGHLPELLLRWLAEQPRTDSIVLFPDYDGIGLANYARLAAKLHPGTELNFYWLPEWQTKLPRFGNATLWRKTRPQFENAMQRLQAMQMVSEEFATLAQLAQFHGKALEQEAIWL